MINNFRLSYLDMPLIKPDIELQLNAFQFESVKNIPQRYRQPAIMSD